MRIIERRLLAEEIGQEEDAAVGRNTGGTAIEPLVDGLACCLGGVLLSACPVPDDPVQEAAARRHAAIREIEARHDVVVDEQPSIGDRTPRRQQDVAGAAEFEDEVPVPRGAANEGGGDMIGAAGHHRRASFEAGVCRGGWSDGPDDGLAPPDRGQQPLGDAGKADQPVVIGAGRDVDETGLQCPVVLDLEAAAEPAGDVVRRAADLHRPGKMVRLVVPKPHQFRPDQLLAEAGSRKPEESAFIHAQAKGIEFARRPGVVLLDAAAEGEAVPIQQNDGRQHAGNASAADLVRINAAFRQQPAADFAAVPPPLLRIFLGPVGVVGIERYRPALERKGLAGIIDDDADGGRRADVEPQQVAHSAGDFSGSCRLCP